MTNFEKIKSMTVEEIAYYLARMTHCPPCPIKTFCVNNYAIDCRSVFTKWLESEAEE